MKRSQSSLTRGTERCVSPAAGSGSEAGGSVDRARGHGCLCSRPLSTLRVSLAIARSVPGDASPAAEGAVPLGLASCRPARRACPPHRPRRSTPACAARRGRCGTRSGHPSRPRAWAPRPPGGERRAPGTLHGPRGRGRPALPLSPWHTGRAAPQLPRLRSGLGRLGRLVSPGPCGCRCAVAPRLSSASCPSAMGLLQARLRRTGRWRQSGAGQCWARTLFFTFLNVILERARSHGSNP
jgi:hypothetical protein